MTLSGSIPRRILSGSLIKNLTVLWLFKLIELANSSHKTVNHYSIFLTIRLEFFDGSKKRQPIINSLADEILSELHDFMHAVIAILFYEVQQLHDHVGL